MKKLFFVFLTFVSCACYSQDITTMDKFVGTWRWVSNTDTLTIVLQRQNLYLNPGISRVSLVGWHKYVKAGHLVQSSLQYVGRDETVSHTDVTTDLKTTLIGHAKTTASIWFTTFWDLSLHSSSFASLTFLPGSTTQATWKLSKDSHWKTTTNGSPTTTSSISELPKNVILTKL